MRISDLLERQRPVFSFEFFPPKTDEGQATLRNTLEVLKDDEPDYVSVTYGAGGTTRNRTVEITKTIKGDLGIEAMAHLSCVGEPQERLVEILAEIEAAGIENVLALRGDPPRGETEWRPHPGGLSYSVELIRLIKERFGFCVGAAGFPEVHLDAPGPRERPPLRAREGRGGRGVPHHPALLRQRGLLRVRRGRARGGHRGADRAGDHADHELRPDPALHRHVRRDDPREPRAAARRARRRPGSGCRARGRLRDPPVLRSPGARRARDPLLHPEPLHGNAGDPGRAASGASVDAARRPRSKRLRGQSPALGVVAPRFAPPRPLSSRWFR